MRFASSLTIITLSHEHGDRTKWNSSHLVAYLIRPSFPSCPFLSCIVSFPLSLSLSNTIYTHKYLLTYVIVKKFIFSLYSNVLLLSMISSKMYRSLRSRTRFERCILDGSSSTVPISSTKLAGDGERCWLLANIGEPLIVGKCLEWKIRGQLERWWKIVGLVGALLAGMRVITREKLISPNISIYSCKRIFFSDRSIDTTKNRFFFSSIKVYTRFVTTHLSSTYTYISIPSISPRITRQVGREANWIRRKGKLLSTGVGGKKGRRKGEVYFTATTR